MTRRPEPRIISERRPLYDGDLGGLSKDVKAVMDVRSAVEQLQRFGVIRKIAELDNRGEYRWEFGLEFENPPSIHATYFEVDDKMPIILKGQSWVMKNGKYVGVVIKGYRSQRIPAITPVTGLLAAVTGTVFNGLATILNNFNPFTTTSDLKGVGVHITASPT